MTKAHQAIGNAADVLQRHFPPVKQHDGPFEGLEELRRAEVAVGTRVHYV